MTVIVARKFGDRILIFADTMMSGRGLSTRSIEGGEGCGYRNTIPGRLKAVVLEGFVSIAYAGVADSALGAVRKFDKLRVSDGIGPALEYLRRQTVPDKGETDGASDFVVALHSPDAELLQIGNGRLQRNLPYAIIGTPNLGVVIKAYEHILSKSDDFRDMYIDEDVTISREERIFSAAVMSLFSDKGVVVREGVGGFPIQLLASPFGHKYLQTACAMAFGEIPGHRPAKGDPDGGMSGWKYNVVPSVLRGVAVLSVLVSQARMAYIYTPLHADEAERVPVRDRYQDAYQDTPFSERRMLERLAELVDKRANELGGGFEVAKRRLTTAS